MKTITLQDFNTLKSARKTRVSVQSKLSAFLNDKIASLEKNKAYEISISDFTDKDVQDVHYYAVLKALRAFDSKIVYDVAMTSASRCNAVRIALK